LSDQSVQGGTSTRPHPYVEIQRSFRRIDARSMRLHLPKAVQQRERLGTGREFQVAV